MSMTVRKTTVSSLNPSFHLPEDVIIEILSRLPVKSLIRFTVVCKLWNALIENPNFISKHFKQNPNPDFNYLILTTLLSNKKLEARLICVGFKTPLYHDFLLFGEINNLFPIVGVCNGLVCFTLSLKELDFVICNLSTRRFRKIPKFDALEADCLRYREAAYGFAFDPCCDDYKLIFKLRYFVSVNERREKAGVYTMSTDSWREIYIDAPTDVDLRVRTCYASALIGSVFYWECYSNTRDNVAFVCFNMFDESFRVISAPEGFNGRTCHWKSVQLYEELAIFAFTSKRSFVVWTLNADSVGWTLRYSMKTNPEVATPGFVGEIGGIKLIGRGKNGDVIYEDRTSGNVKLFYYDLERGDITRLPFSGDYYQVIRYKESLIPVKKNNQV